MYRPKSGGYAGLIMLIVTAAIIAVIFWRSDLFMSSPHATSTSPGGYSGLSPLPPAPVIEQDVNAIQQAKTAQQQLESQSQFGTH